jgi:PAS domain S-box-containing protein
MAQLEQSRAWLQAIMDYSPNVIIIKDFAGRYLMVNHQLEDLLQLEAGEANGKTDYAIFPQKNADLHHKTDVDVYSKRGAVTYEETLEINGETRVFQASKFPLHDGNGHPFALCAIWSDVTDRKRTEEALRQREADLRQAEHVAHLGSWTWNVIDDTSRWSDELYRILGLEPPNHVDDAIAGAERQMAPETTAQIRNALEVVRRDGRPHETEMQITRPDGSVRWLAARGDVVRNEKGEVIAVAGTAQDITELKELQRMRDEWTSVMAHDLRQPIGVITMAASVLPELHDASLVDKEKDMIARIASSADGLARLVDDLLDLSLVEAHRLSLDRHWWKPQTVVNEAVERLSQLTDGHPIVVSAEQSLPEVCVDQMRIGQVLGNLISNAVKYGDAGSEIRVRVEWHDSEVEIDVENHGAGIPEHEIPLLFNRFTRTKKAQRSGTPGLGVGLYISKALVEAHGGRIWVDSRPGETTTFHVALPARPAEQQQVA